MRLRIAAPFLALAIVLTTGCRHEAAPAPPIAAPAPPPQAPSRQVEITRPNAKNNEVTLKRETVTIPKTGDPIEETLNALLSTATDAHGPSAIPNGTRLLSLKVDKSLATVDLNKDFERINNGGDTGESLAQNALRKALAQFPQVQKMTVLVEGKPFEGAHSGPWSEIPVRDDPPPTEGAH